MWRTDESWVWRSTTTATEFIDERLPDPDTDVVLGPDWALQDPNDYLETFKRAVPGVLAKTGVDPDRVIGIGIDFTACTMLPTKADGTPLCFLDAYRREPHAWVKLWKSIMQPSPRQTT
jgi:L-ribulokinase